MHADYNNMTDRDFCYWLEGYIDKVHSYWAKLEDKKRREFVKHFDDEQGKELYRRVESARRNRRGQYDKYTIFVEWVAGILEVWGHLDDKARKVANDSINRELCAVLRSYDPEKLQASFSSPAMFTCSSIDDFDKYNDQHYQPSFVLSGST